MDASISSAAADGLRRRKPASADPSDLADPGYDEKYAFKSKNTPVDRILAWEYVWGPAILTFFAFFTRLYKIGLSPIVTWDEAHFGKFGSHYLKREFYFDVHPPLGKMLVGLSGYLAGYNGSFEFKSGERYPENLNYTFMRVFNATFGALCIPLAYYTAKELRFKLPTVWLVALMVLCENSYSAISRFILLDSMLLFFTFSTIFCWSKFHNQRFRPMEFEWLFWMLATGLSIGCVCSVKMVGLFCTSLVGLYTVEDLWRKFGNPRVSNYHLGMHVVTRVVCLILVPFMVYAASFLLHFTILANSGPGDAQMSSLFQANLRGTNVGKNSPLEVALGSRVTIKNMGYGGGLLHSHVQTYPDGSNQQQVTCYHHKDTNNDWFVYPHREEPFDRENSPAKFIGNGDIIRLIHTQTGRNLHSHKLAAPVTKADWEVSCYGNLTVGDTKDHWVVEVVDDAASRDYSKVRTLTTSFRLRHKDLGCYLRAGNVNLPQWGFKQIEVTCAKKSSKRDKHTMWNIESHWNDKLPPGDPGSYKSPFWRDFIHLNVAMMTSNNALVPDPDKQDDLASHYWQWPILNVGLRMCSWDEKTVKYFLLGNPIVYWGSTLSLGVVVAMFGVYLLRWQRGYQDLLPDDMDHFLYSGLYPLVGWVLHYLPFVIMARVTYVHHYYPALYFAILCFGFCVDWALSRSSKNGTQSRARFVVFPLLYLLVIGLYWHFRVFNFGMVGPSSQWKHLAWSTKWRVAD